MDITSVVGLLLGFGSILGGFLLEDGKISQLGHLSPFIIIFGGTAGAVLLSFPLKDVLLVPQALKTIFTDKKVDQVDMINQLAELSEKARKDGLLSLEQDAQSNENELIRKGLALVVDGIETEIIKDILVREIMLYENIYENSAKIFESAGGFAPTMGVCGTVLGMIVVLSNMSNPEELGPKIAIAFIATLLGVSFANLAFLPMASKIKMKAQNDAMVSDLIIEGLLSIQAGENPRIIKEKLNLALLEKLNNKGGAKTAAPDEARDR